jgi:hypothetical protein
MGSEIAETPKGKFALDDCKSNDLRACLFADAHTGKGESLQGGDRIPVSRGEEMPKGPEGRPFVLQGGEQFKAVNKREERFKNGASRVTYFDNNNNEVAQVFNSDGEMLSATLTQRSDKGLPGDVKLPDGDPRRVDITERKSTFNSNGSYSVEEQTKQGITTIYSWASMNDISPAQTIQKFDPRSDVRFAVSEVGGTEYTVRPTSYTRIWTGGSDYAETLQGDVLGAKASTYATGSGNWSGIFVGRVFSVKPQ